MRLRQVCFTFQRRWGSKLTGSHWWLKKAPLVEQRHLLCRCRISTCPHSSAQSTSHSFSWVALPTFCNFHFFTPPCRPWPKEARFRFYCVVSTPPEGFRLPTRHEAAAPGWVLSFSYPPSASGLCFSKGAQKIQNYGRCGIFKKHLLYIL